MYLGGPSMHATPDLELAHPDGESFASVAYLGAGADALVATYAGWRAEWPSPGFVRSRSS